MEYAELRPQDRPLVDHMAHYILSCGVLQAIQCGDIATAQDSIIKIAQEYQIDLDSKDRWRFQEACRNAARAQLLHEGLITAYTDETGKQQYKITPGREQEYKDTMYKASYCKDMMDGCAATFKLVEKAGNVTKGISSIITVANLTLGSKLQFLGHVKAFAEQAHQSFEKVAGLKGDLGKVAAQEVLKAVNENTDKADDLQKAFKNSRKAVEEYADKIKHQMPRDVGTSIADAVLSDKQEKEFRQRSGLSNGGSLKVPTLRELAAEQKEIKSGRASDMFASFLEIDQQVREGKPPITRKDASWEACEETKFRLGAKIPIAASIWNVTTGIRNLLCVEMPHNIVTSILKATENGNRENPGWVRSRLDNFRKSLQDKVNTEWYRKDPMGAAMMEIKGYNYDNKESRDRGRNYAEQYGQLNVYRCGISKNLVNSMHIFNMDDLDRVWASAYLMAAMKETIHGIRYDKTGLEVKAEAVFNRYLKEPFEENAKAAREAIEKDLIDKHSEMVVDIARMREAAELRPLYNGTPMNEALGNPADPGGKDHLDVVKVTQEQFISLDVEQLIKDGRDGFYIDCNDSAALFLFSEDKGVAAVLDEYKMPLEMRLTSDTDHRQNAGLGQTMAAMQNRCNELFSDQITKTLAQISGCQTEKEMLQQEWRPKINKLVAMGIRPKIVGREVMAAIIDPKTGLKHELGKNPEREFKEFSSQTKAMYCEEVLREAGAPEAYIRHVTEKDPELASYIYFCPNAHRGDDGIIRGTFKAEGKMQTASFIVIDGDPVLVGKGGQPDMHATRCMMRGDYGEQWADAIKTLDLASIEPSAPGNIFDNILMDNERDDSRANIEKAVQENEIGR